MTSLKHRWEGADGKADLSLAVCTSCGIRRRTRVGAAGGIPLVEYLVSGVGWTPSRPECYVPGVEQLSILPAPPELKPIAPVPVHRCHAFACETPVPPRFLMCHPHWFMVPKHMRDRVWATYRRGQEVDKRPSREYVDAMNDAIVHVARMEGKPI